MSPRELGRRAELAVADYLFAQGFDILARNARFGALEIDIVARRGPLVVATEVRARGSGSYLGPFASVTRIKQARLQRAADRLWRERLARMPGVYRLRIDVAAVKFAGERTVVEYAPGALSTLA